jgi:hypothetical protein
MAGATLGCLDEPPTFESRLQIPPFIIAGQVDPPLAAVYEGPVPFQISVPFRSEDVSINLDARLYLDLVPGAAERPAVEGTLLPAGNYEDLRVLSMDWTRRITGCHSLTLIMTYDGNFDVSGLPRDDTLAARVVWWLNVGDSEGDVRMVTCPGASQVDVVPSGP